LIRATVIIPMGPVGRPDLGPPMDMYFDIREVSEEWKWLVIGGTRGETESVSKRCGVKDEK
jgi:hypothetical protein